MISAYRMNIYHHELQIYQKKYCLNSLTFFKFVTSFLITTIILTCDKINVSQQIKYLGQHSFTVFICSVELCHLKLFILFELIFIKSK